MITIASSDDQTGLAWLWECFVFENGSIYMWRKNDDASFHPAKNKNKSTKSSDYKWIFYGENDKDTRNIELKPSILLGHVDVVVPAVFARLRYQSSVCPYGILYSRDLPARLGKSGSVYLKT